MRFLLAVMGNANYAVNESGVKACLTFTPLNLICFKVQNEIQQKNNLVNPWFRSDDASQGKILCKTPNDGGIIVGYIFLYSYRYFNNCC
jgi:hypothetical protein